MTTNNEKCPLCKGKVLYRGLVSLECNGAGCQNFKPGSRELDLPFEDVLVDFPWVIALALELNRVSGLTFYATKDLSGIFGLHCVDRPRLNARGFRGQTQLQLKTWLLEHYLPWMLKEAARDD